MPLRAKVTFPRIGRKTGAMRLDLTIITHLAQAHVLKVVNNKLIH